MRILVVTNLYPPHAYGGYEGLCAGAVAAWQALGHEVRVLTSDLRRDDVAEDGDTAVARRLPIYWRNHHRMAPPIRTRLAWERRSLRTARRALDEWQPDVVSIWNPAGLSLAIFHEISRRGLPAVLVIGDVWLDHALAGDAWRRMFEHRWTRLLRPLADRLAGSDVQVPRIGEPTIACFASEYLREHARTHARWPLDEAALVPHGLDPANYPTVSPRFRERVGGRLLYVGRVAREKDIATPIRALGELDGRTLEIVGAGQEEYRRELGALAAELGVGDAVRFVGQLGGASLREAYERADALIFPSAWQEPFGLVPLEAMACGIPVVATGTGGSGEFLIDGVTALRFPVGEPEALASALRRLGRDDDLRRRLVANGLGVAAWLSRERTYDELDAWHRYAVGEIMRRPADRTVLPPALEPVVT